jgi:hypothetical protein
MKTKAILATFGLLAATCVLVVAGAEPVGAVTAVTVGNSSDTVDGNTSNAAQTTLREAIDLVNVDPANENALITIQSGLQIDLTTCGAGDENDNLYGDLDLLDDEVVTILGSDVTITQTCSNERVLDQRHADGGLELARVTVTGGRTNSNGGGVRAVGNVDLVLGTRIQGNRASISGGGVWAGGSVDVAQSRVRDNTASVAGGGVHAGSTLRFYRSQISGNVAGTAGGGFDGDGNVRVQTSTLTQNRADDLGGGGHADGYVVLDVATVLANRAPDGANLSAGDDIRAVSSVIALGSGGPDCEATNGFDSSGYNVGNDLTCLPSHGTDVTVVHPMLAGLDPEGTNGFSSARPPVVGSPVLDLDPTACVGQPDDQYFHLRPSVGGGACDSGAIERTPPACTSSGFPDVGAGNEFAPDVCWLAQMDITGGYPDGGFHPADPVTRQSMSAFLFRLAGAPLFPTPTSAVFSDVGVNHPFAREIAWLVDEDIAEGYSDGTFKGGAAVSRQAMAAFMYRVAGVVSFLGDGPTFTDVGIAHPFYEEIEWMAWTEVAGGYPDGTFKPANAVSRQAMAAFLHRMAAGVDLDGI